MLKPALLATLLIVAAALPTDARADDLATLAEKTVSDWKNGPETKENLSIYVPLTRAWKKSVNEVLGAGSAGPPLDTGQFVQQNGSDAREALEELLNCDEVRELLTSPEFTEKFDRVYEHTQSTGSILAGIPRDEIVKNLLVATAVSSRGLPKNSEFCFMNISCRTRQ